MVEAPDEVTRELRRFMLLGTEARACEVGAPPESSATVASWSSHITAIEWYLGEL